MDEDWAAGIDLGGTKLEAARIDSKGVVRDSIKMPTRVESGPAGIEADVERAVGGLRERAERAPIAVGIGIAGQIDSKDGSVLFSPNLDWRQIPFQRDMEERLGLPTVVMNDVRAITWGEWIYGAGKGFNHVVCLFVGTGVGGGVISGGSLLSGCANAAGELGHIAVDMNGPVCTCGNRGCLEAFVGGWAIARRAQQMVRQDRDAGERLVALAGGTIEGITAEAVARSAYGGDPLCLAIIDLVGHALTAGCVSLVNAFNPCRLILGGGVVDGIPELIDKVRHGVRQFALPAVTAALEVMPGALGSSAGVVGAASFAVRTLAEKAQAGGDRP
jgi:glucokinase